MLISFIYFNIVIHNPPKHKTLNLDQVVQHIFLYNTAPPQVEFSICETALRKVTLRNI